ncbi:MAG TPA: pyridine nucleotide-disulfide oxidoreductase [Verrucomicrobia bacterium]|nr:pyridine nucleotide-disulfide oxidoreductase [Verrucomicrobiota bacterium]
MKKPTKWTLFAAAFAALAAPADNLHLEAEAFETWGGWVNDTQFMDADHSSYLLAHGLGKPVANAKTTFEIAAPGPHTLLVRTKNWTAPWSKSAAGTFQIKVDGVVQPKVLGAEGQGEWLTETAGVVPLAKGVHTLELVDLTGFDGRCDWVEVKSDIAAPIPAAPVKVEKRAFDLVVVGGGIAGTTAAISAARLGLSVALVQDRPVLGGNNSSEIRVHLGAWQNMPPYPRLGDVLAEIAPARGGNAQPKAIYEDDRKLAVVKAEKNISLFLNTRVDAVSTNGVGRILSVSGRDTRTGNRTVFSGRWFVDATGDGTVGYLAGADWREGREAKSETGEAWAPEKADMLTMGASVQWYAGTTKDGKPVAFPQQPWMIRLTDANGHQGVHGDWDWEAGLGREQIAEAEYIRDYGLLVAFSNWGYVKNLASNRTEYANKELKWVAYNAGRRESRRLMGDWILSENDIDARTVFPDATCAATWTIDLHWPKSAKDSKFDGEPFRSDSLNKTIWPMAIPYRCYYSRNVPNLFMAGRDISVTHIALGTTRLMRTHGMMGEVVGMAAAICAKHGCDPRAVYTDYLDELKALMTKGVGDGKKHPEQRYNIQDSLDPAFKWNKRNHQLR